MHTDVTNSIVAFLNELGISCQATERADEAFLPGIYIDNGKILYNPTLMKHPGDLLHEAGHLAVQAPADRVLSNAEKMNGDLQPEGAEMAAIAWSWAALKHLQLEPAILFHEEGYRGGSSALIENFTEGRYLGVPILQWLGMTRSGSNASAGGQAYPEMVHWLRQE
jgi:hypothetical protein